MEKTISAEERIRRAEEIYERRKNANMGTSMPYARVNIGERKHNYPIRKMIIQIIICMAIYASFYYIENGEITFKNNITEKIKSILEYDISFQNVTDNILNYINKKNNENVEIPIENQEIVPTENYEEIITEGISEEEKQTETLRSNR